MKRFSKNVKLNAVLNGIYEDLQELGISEVKRYYKEYEYEPDYNIAEYGNLLIYYEDIRNLYKDYKSMKNWSDNKLWETYKGQVGYVTRLIMRGEV
jgi:hypothetical protein